MAGGSIRSPARDRDSFDRRHAGWLGRVPDGPLYCLPELAIARLGQTGRGRPPLLDGPAREAERDLLALCRDHHAVGFDGPGPIIYPYLEPPTPLPARDLYPDLGWAGAHWLAAEWLLGRIGRANLRLRGYAGWLATEPPFLDAAAGLASRWGALPDGLRPGLPLRRPTATAGAPGGPSPDLESAGAFAVDLGSFCDRWGLIGMATWDLPLPQGPLLPSPLPPGSPALPAHAVHLVLPVPCPHPRAADRGEGTARRAGRTAVS